MSTNLDISFDGTKPKDKKSVCTSIVPPLYLPQGTNQNQEFQVISLLESHGFEVDKKYIKKRNSQNRLEVCGNFNEHTIYFHATNNIYPFESSKSYSFYSLLKGFNTTLVSNDELERIYKKRASDKLKQKDKKTIDFKKYLSITNDTHNFNLQTLLDSYHKNRTTRIIGIPKIWENDNNVRATYGKTHFPVIDANDKFITAQVIQYKTDLKRNRDTNIYYLPTNGEIGLYRRNLYDETLNTIIVESPKLAELGALVLPKFNWFATFGKERLNKLDLSFLNPSRTFILSDIDAFDEWKDIAVNKWNFEIIDIFQKEITRFSEDTQKQYSDFADLILHYLLCREDDVIDAIFNKIYNSLVNLFLEDDYLLKQNNPQIESYNEDLGFKEKKNLKSYFISSIPKDFSVNTGGIYKCSSHGGYKLPTKYFDVYTQDFEVISASFDVCKTQDEQQFISNLMRTFIALRYLNENTYLSLFEIVLSNVQTKGNYLFNQKHILSVLVPQWEAIEISEVIEDLIKVRNYNYIGGGNFNNYEFLDELRKAKKLYTVHAQLFSIQQAVKKGIDNRIFIKKSDIGIQKEAGNEYIFNLINRFNLLSIGTTDKRICKVVQTLVTYNITIDKGYYYLRNDKISINKTFELTAINRKTLTHLLKFQRNKSVIENMLIEINYLIDNPNSFYFEKVTVKGKVHNSVSPIFADSTNVISLKYLPMISLEDAFTNEMTIKSLAIAVEKGYKAVNGSLKGSILECEEEEARQSGADFYVSWYCFQYPQVTAEDREYLWKHRHAFYNDKFQMHLKDVG
jgi:hypothetical protein